MAALKVSELVEGRYYTEPLSGHRVQVRRISARTAAGEPYKAECRYFNRVAGRFFRFEVGDGDLEEEQRMDTYEKRYQR